MKTINKRYLPKTLSIKDYKRQLLAINKTRKMYKRGKFIERPMLPSFHSKPSNHVEKAKQMYGVNSIVASKNVAKKTGCSVSSLKKILNKGRGAYYSSGSRPNQTAESWARARLASAITSGPASKIDKKILVEGCHHNSKALRLSL